MPKDSPSPFFAAERQEKIAATRGRVHLDELASVFEVSQPSDLIEDGEAIFLDCGTTTHHVAQQLATRGLHLTIKRPQRVIVPMDRSKIGIADFAKVCEPREIDVLVTDCANDDLRRICAAHEIKLEEASAPA